MFFFKAELYHLLILRRNIELTSQRLDLFSQTEDFTNLTEDLF